MDTLALVPLILQEPATPAMSALFQADPALVVWWGTAVELESALARSLREGRFEEDDWRDALETASKLTEDSLEVQPMEAIRNRARNLVRLHPLRAADAFQLAAALAWCEDQPRDTAFVTLDDRLRTAAGIAGFEVLPGTTAEFLLPASETGEGSILQAVLDERDGGVRGPELPPLRRQPTSSAACRWATRAVSRPAAVRE